MNIALSKLLATIVSAISPKLYIKLSYFHNRGAFPNLKTPKNLSEIILASICSGKVNDYSRYVDKIEVREELKSWGFSTCLPKLYGVWDSPEDIDFEKLPNSFALKTNHGCGSHYICKDKKNMDVNVARETINAALVKRSWRVETQYNAIPPKVFCEEFIDDGTAGPPIDYKFLCLDGVIKCILVVTAREGSKYNLSTYDINWNRLDLLIPKHSQHPPLGRPKNLQEMVLVASEIATKFEFVRVDLYDLGDRIIIGELTFTPHGGILSNFTTGALEKLGR